MSLHTLAAASTTALLALACSGSGPPPATPKIAGADPVVAEIEGEPVLQSELDAWIKDDWFRRETQSAPSELFELRARSLERLIDERVVENAARSRQLDPRELVDLEAAAREPVSDEQIETFYAENKERLVGRELEDLKPQIRAYLEGQRRLEVVAVLREDAQVEVMLEQPRVEVSADGPSIGPADAPVTIVEFSDFQCPFCQRALSTIAGIREKYPNEVRIVYRHLPLDRIHSRARAAAEASACADEQGRFWEYHDTLFVNSKALSPEDLARYAADVGLDPAQFEKCVSEQRFREKIDADIAAAREAGITSTPSFVVDGTVISGARPADAFVPLIEAALGRTGTGS